MRTKSDHWQKIIQAHTKSSLSAAAFCRKKKINIYQFRWWQRRFRRDEGLSPKVKPGDFLRLMPDPEFRLDRPACIHLCLPNGIRILVEPGFDPTTLRNIMTTILSKETPL